MQPTVTLIVNFNIKIPNDLGKILAVRLCLKQFAELSGSIRN